MKLYSSRIFPLDKRIICQVGQDTPLQFITRIKTQLSYVTIILGTENVLSKYLETHMGYQNNRYSNLLPKYSVLQCVAKVLGTPMYYQSTRYSFLHSTNNALHSFISKPQICYQNTRYSFFTQYPKYSVLIFHTVPQVPS